MPRLRPLKRTTAPTVPGRVTRSSSRVPLRSRIAASLPASWSVPRRLASTFSRAGLQPFPVQRTVTTVPRFTRSRRSRAIRAFPRR